MILGPGLLTGTKFKKSMEPILYMRRMETMLVENWFMYTTCVVHGAIHIASVEQSLCTHPGLYKTLASNVQEAGPVFHECLMHLWILRQMKCIHKHSQNFLHKLKILNSAFKQIITMKSCD